MLDFLQAYWGEIVVGTVIAGGVILAAAKLRRDKKRGKATCGCSCRNCPSAGICHQSSKITDD